MMEIIYHIAECYTCIYRWKCNHYSKCLRKAENTGFFNVPKMASQLNKTKEGEVPHASQKMVAIIKIQ